MTTPDPIAAYSVVIPRRKERGVPKRWTIAINEGNRQRFVGDIVKEDGRKIFQQQTWDSEAEAFKHAQENGLPNPHRYLDCLVCGEQAYEDYMVLPEVWKDEARFMRGVCHLTCLEERLGRPLTVEDFDLNIPINRVLAFGYRMKGKTS